MRALRLLLICLTAVFLAGCVGRVKETVPEWQKSDETLKTWLIHLVHAGLVEKVSSGIYRIH